MVVTLQDCDKHNVYASSKDKRFHEAYGNVVKLPKSALYEDLAQMTFWCNNELGDELLVEFA